MAKTSASERRPMGSLETAVLAQLWAHPAGATPSEIRSGLTIDVAYTTVTTVLARLWKKQLVEREAQGRTFLYRSLLSEGELVARRMESVLEQTHDRRAALSQFVDGLSAKDGRVLRTLLDDRWS